MFREHAVGNFNGVSQTSVWGPQLFDGRFAVATLVASRQILRWQC